MWSDEERRERKDIIVAEAHRPNYSLNSRTFTRQHPPSPFLLSPSHFLCAQTRSASLQKQHKEEERKVFLRSNPGELEKKGLVEFSLPPSLCARPTALFLDENVPLDEGIRRPL